MNLRERVETRSVRGLTRAACMLALVGLAVLCFSVVVPRPLPVIFAMSAGHVIGVAAFLSYLLAVVLDAARRDDADGGNDDEGVIGAKETKP